VVLLHSRSLMGLYCLLLLKKLEAQMISVM
jgi:hypothetical protein